jgi:hypothetical protein
MGSSYSPLFSFSRIKQYSSGGISGASLNSNINCGLPLGILHFTIPTQAPEWFCSG